MTGLTKKASLKIDFFHFFLIFCPVTMTGKVIVSTIECFHPSIGQPVQRRETVPLIQTNFLDCPVTVDPRPVDLNRFGLILHCVSLTHLFYYEAFSAKSQPLNVTFFTLNPRLNSSHVGRLLSGIAFHSLIWPMRVTASCLNWSSVIFLITQ